jgi:hypothetical protein
MTAKKHPLNPQRIRQVPKQFSWVDHRLVRDRHIEYCSHSAATLYLFLVTVSDSQGLSYYSDASIMQRLSIDGAGLDQARQNLIELSLIAYKRPLYQVLALDEQSFYSRTNRDATSPGCPLPVGQVLKQLMEGAP